MLTKIYVNHKKIVHLLYFFNSKIEHLKGTKMAFSDDKEIYCKLWQGLCFFFSHKSSKNDSGKGFSNVLNVTVCI